MNGVITEKEVIEQAKQMFSSDSARIIHTSSRMFLVVGYNRNTKDDKVCWIRNSEPINFDYLEEKVIASGTTYKELKANAIEYERISHLTIEDYLEEYLTV